MGVLGWTERELDGGIGWWSSVGGRICCGKRPLWQVTTGREESCNEDDERRNSGSNDEGRRRRTLEEDRRAALGLGRSTNRRRQRRNNGWDQRLSPSSSATHYFGMVRATLNFCALQFTTRLNFLREYQIQEYQNFSEKYGIKCKISI